MGFGCIQYLWTTWATVQWQSFTITLASLIPAIVNNSLYDFSAACIRVGLVHCLSKQECILHVYAQCWQGAGINKAKCWLLVCQKAVNTCLPFEETIIIHLKYISLPQLNSANIKWKVGAGFHKMQKKSGTPFNFEVHQCNNESGHIAITVSAKWIRNWPFLTWLYHVGPHLL